MTTIARASRGSAQDTERSEREEQLRCSIRQSAATPYHWMETLGALSEELGGAAIGLAIVPTSREHPGLGYAVGILPEYSESFASTYFSLAPWAEAASRCPPGEVHFHRVRSEELSETRFYREWMEPQGLLPVAPLCAKPGPPGGELSSQMMAFQRVEGRALGTQHVALLERLMPDLQMAVARNRGLLGLGGRPFAATLDLIRTPVAHLDLSGRVRWTNASMSQLLADASLLSTSSGRIAATRAEDRLHLMRALQEVARVPGEVAVRLRPGRGEPLAIVILQRSPESDLVRLFVARGSEAHRPAAVWVDALGLTPAEQRVFGHLAGGLDVVDIAREMSIQPNTVRQYLKQIYSKTGLHNQKELVRLAAACAAAGPPDPGTG